MNSGLQVSEIIRYANFLNKQQSKFSYIIQVCGNHDILFEKNSPLAEDVLTSIIGKKLTYLKDSSFTVNNINFYGSPWTPAFMSWGFMKYTAEELMLIWDNIPKNTDILITHGPAYGMLDTVCNGGEPLGCKELAKKINQIKPKFHIFGHIHGGYGILKTKHTTYINCSICTEKYKPINNPISIDI